jgi:hypothetical protein
MTNGYLIPQQLTLTQEQIATLDAFLGKFSSVESENKAPLIVHFDRKCAAHYITCHMNGEVLVKHCDLEATIDDAEDDELYKLNREITEDETAYKQMEKDALAGRSFEDIVIEYDTSYRSNKPLKVYGGQHRITAITKALKAGVSVPHGVRIYFRLTREQKVEIAIVNNTSIAVPNDLLDRMHEQMMGPELREWCQKAGLLGPEQDLADKRNPDIPTARIVRTLIVNYYTGIQASDQDFHQPILCKSGGIDDDYGKIRKHIDWDDKNFIEMGKQYARLHKVQSERVKNRDYDNYAEFARKVFSYSIVAGWGYAAGLFQRNRDYLAILYALPNSVQEPDDPLNAKDLSGARLQGVDKDTYRGLGTRSSSNELGRILELFIVLATKASKKRITKQLANAAIQSYEAKMATHEADKALGKI